MVPARKRVDGFESLIFHNLGFAPFPLKGVKKSPSGDLGAIPKKFFDILVRKLVNLINSRK
jgi:hypothetical protein